MTRIELEVVSQLDQLPRRTSSRTLIGYLGSNALYFFGAMEKGKVFFTDDGSTKRRVSEDRRRYLLRYRSSSAPKVHHSFLHRQRCSADSPGASTFFHPSYFSPCSRGCPRKSGGKRKSSRERSIYSHKRRKRKIPEGPLIVGPLDLNVRIVEHLQ
ncbi:uncharacterized protein LOC128195545 isoform X2 [Vigna angularis]|uniref:uncharacterized protein LOC128195545 isoform X2 n=1 Tax=Phaseolus angularis TaxID=3914 RepID=UPI0022B36F49|nr:uncharacterized protein LOC128195545 isoform X2 [Vigna angularis]